jgi:serine phosphatase RsbU (regulator of sigma subunit)
LFLDVDGKSVRYASAGHPPMILHRIGENNICEYSNGGIVMGPFSDATYEVETIPVQVGDRLILYTDGVIETKNHSGHFFGDGSFNSFITSHGHLSATDFADSLLNHLAQWSGKPSNASLDDDLTLVVLDKL